MDILQTAIPAASALLGAALGASASLLGLRSSNQSALAYVFEWRGAEGSCRVFDEGQIRRIDGRAALFLRRRYFTD